MTHITLNDLDESRTLSTEEQQALRGGNWWMLPIFRPRFVPFYQPRYNPYTPYASGYGGFTNQFRQGTFGHGIQAATFAGQALGDQRHATFMANF